MAAFTAVHWLAQLIFVSVVSNAHFASLRTGFLCSDGLATGDVECRHRSLDWEMSSVRIASISR